MCLRLAAGADLRGRVLAGGAGLGGTEQDRGGGERDRHRQDRELLEDGT